MKKIISITMAFVLLLAMSISLVGCGQEEEPSVGMPNPMTEYDSLEEINDIVHCALVHPGVMGVIEEHYATIDCTDYVIADYQFELNGTKFTFRAANTEEDICGVWVGEGTIFELNPDLSYYYDDEYCAARWFTMDGQYTLVCGPENLPEPDSFTPFADELMELTMAATAFDYSSIYEMLAGEWQDTVSQRATMTITNQGDYLDIEVDWASSASEYNRWLMTATSTEDGELDYSDCQMAVVTVADDGTEEAVTDYIDGTGYFTYKADTGMLYWEGAEDESCVECAFEKVE